MPTQYCIYLRKSRQDLEAEARGEGDTLARHRRTLTELAEARSLSVPATGANPAPRRSAAPTAAADVPDLLGNAARFAASIRQATAQPLDKMHPVAAETGKGRRQFFPLGSAARFPALFSILLRYR